MTGPANVTVMFPLAFVSPAFAVACARPVAGVQVTCDPGVPVVGTPALDVNVNTSLKKLVPSLNAGPPSRSHTVNVTL